jgi:hypothetical protein
MTTIVPNTTTLTSTAMSGKTDDSLAFLSSFGDNDPDNFPGYPPPDSAPTRATAFMMDDGHDPNG